jgi:hypothetical protein
MTPAEQYHVRSAELMARARAEHHPVVRAEYEQIALSYLRLSQRADR